VLVEDGTVEVVVTAAVDGVVGFTESATPWELEQPVSAHRPTRAATTVAPPAHSPCLIGTDLLKKAGP